MILTTNGKELKPGMVVSTAFRKTALYSIVDIGPDAITIDRVRASNGFPSAGDKLKMLRLRDVEAAQLYYVGDQKNPTKYAGISSLSSAKTLDEMYETIPFESKNIIKEFATLLSDLSPENLTCDGEASMPQVRNKQANIERKWSLLESYVGHKVSKDWPSKWNEIFA